MNEDNERPTPNPLIPVDGIVAFEVPMSATPIPEPFEFGSADVGATDEREPLLIGVASETVAPAPEFPTPDIGEPVVEPHAHTAAYPAPPGPWWSSTASNPASVPQPGLAPPQFSRATSPGVHNGSAALTARTARSVLVGAVVGALVASLVTGGLFIAFRENKNTTTKVADSSDSFAKTSNTTPVTPIPTSKEGDINVKAVLARVRPAVVVITVQTPQGKGGGTGFIVGANGTIVTNAHVVNQATAVKVTLASGDQLDAHIKGVDVRHDLAVITIPGSKYPTVALGDSDTVNPGDSVIAVGNALGLGISVTKGVISALDRQVDEPNGTVILGALQTDAAINPGNSGGPLVNSQGQVIGVNTAIASPTESTNIGFAISISSARHIIDALIAGRTPLDAFLGVTTDDVTPSLVQQHTLKTDRGAYVANVRAGSPADTSGIKVGAVVTEIDGTPVTGRDELRRLIRRHSPGDRATFIVVDQSGAKKVIEIRLGEAPTVTN